jgi:hypothetical protein
VLDVKYGVIVCPKCGMAKGVEAYRKTATCQCGRKIKMSAMKLMFLTDSPMELADSVAMANASLHGDEHFVVGKKGRKKKDPFFALSERAKLIKDPLERMRVIARELTTLKVEFTFEDMRKVAGIVGKDSPEDMIARLKEHNLIYESGDGRYRSV